jgi:hypothetical protein
VIARSVFTQPGPIPLKKSANEPFGMDKQAHLWTSGRAVKWY